MTELRRVLARLYPTVQDSQLVVADAGLNSEYITFQPRAVNNWFNILEEAQKHNKVQAIINVAHSEFPENEELNHAIEQVRLEQLHADAEQAGHAAEWARAIDLLDQIVGIDPDYKDASQRLDQAKEQQHLGQLYVDAKQAGDAAEWARAIDLLDQIVGIDPDYKDASQRLRQAKKQQRLEQLYTEAMQAESNEDWPMVIAICCKIILTDPFYPDGHRLLWKAFLHYEQRAQDFWKHHKILIALLSLLACGLSKSAFFHPQTSVDRFLITTEGNPTITVSPGEMINVTVQEIIQIEIEISTTCQGQQKGLVFTWYTCREKKARRRYDSPQILYIAPNEPGIDCVCVAVEKGGDQLDRKRIFVKVHR